MFESIINFFKRSSKKEEKITNSKSAAKERLHLVLMQDRANVSADFLELMKQEIIEVIKKYIEVDESAIDVRLTNKENEDGTNGAPALYANIPIVNIKNETRKIEKKEDEINKDNVEKQSKDDEENKITDGLVEENKQDKEINEEKKQEQTSEILEANKSEIEKTTSTNKEKEEKVESNK